MWFDPCSFVLSPAGTFGNLGRNTLTSPGLVDVDATLVKTMKLNDRMSVQLRGEFFNLLNHANFDQPGSQLFNGDRSRNVALVYS